LTPDEQRLAAKSMAVNAGALEAMDAELGGLIDYLKSTDDYENTVFVVTSDNGPEAGDPWGAAIGWWMGLHDYSRSYDNLGEKGSYVAIGPGGASANAGPSHLFKFHTGEGGLRVPMLMAGPGIEAGAEVESFTVMSDIAPTLLDLARAREPSSSAVSMTGRSLVPVLAGQSDRTYFDGDAIGIETSGQAALYKGRYKLVRSLPPHGDSTWRLFDILDDPGETTDLAARIPGVMENLTHEYRLYANRVGVLELPEGYQVERAIARNMLGKLWQHYWGWIIIGAAVLLAGIGGVGLAGRALWRRLG
jgi:arylsulfatase A-like enzyme